MLKQSIHFLRRRVQSTLLGALVAATAALGSVPACAAIIYDGGAPDGLNANEATAWLQTENFTLGSASPIDGATIYIGGVGGIGAWGGLVNYFFFDDAGGQPGALLASGAGANVTTTDTAIPFPDLVGGNVFQVAFDFAGPFAAAAATNYFFGIHLSNSYATQDGVYWATTASTVSGTGRESEGGTLDNWFDNGYRHAFQLTTDLSRDVDVDVDVPEPSALALLGVALLSIFIFDLTLHRMRF